MTMTPGPGSGKSGAGKWLVIGGIGCLGVLLLGGCLVASLVGFFWQHAEPARTAQLEETVPALPPTDNTPTGAEGTAVEASTYTPDRSQLNADLQGKYVPFTFTIPPGWEVTERGDQAGESNYVKVEKRDATKSTLENFAVGWMSGAGSLQRDKSTYAGMADQIGQQLAQGFDGFAKTREGPVTVNGYQAYELLFRGNANDNGQALPVCGRVIMISGGNVGELNGVALLMLATEQSGIRDPAQIGKSGDYAALLNSFKLGQ